MTRFVVTAWLGLAALAAVAAEEVPVFVLSQRFGFSIAVDGVPQRDSTPALLSVPAGDRTIALTAPGYQRAERVVRIEGPSAVIVTINPTPRFSPIRAGENLDIVVEGTEAGDQASLTDGAYRVRRGLNAVYFEPTYPAAARLERLRWLTALTIAAAGTASVIEYLQPPEDPGPIVPVHGILQAGALIGTGLTLHALVDRARFRESIGQPIPTGDESGYRELLERAEQLLAEGNIDGAIALFDQVVADDAAGPLRPSALYRRARLARAVGDADTAVRLLTILREDYPVPAYYDRATFQLAQLAIEDGDGEAAHRMLDAIVGVDPDVTEALVAQTRARLEALTTPSDR